MQNCLAQMLESFHDRATCLAQTWHWLNMAAIEISIFARGCLSRRVKSMQDLRRRIATLETQRNAQRSTISWRFTSKACSCHIA